MEVQIAPRGLSECLSAENRGFLRDDIAEKPVLRADAPCTVDNPDESHNYFRLEGFRVILEMGRFVGLTNVFGFKRLYVSVFQPGPIVWVVVKVLMRKTFYRPGNHGVVRFV